MLKIHIYLFEQFLQMKSDKQDSLGIICSTDGE